MAKPWDKALRWLIRTNPQAFIGLLVPDAHFIRAHPDILEPEKLEVDGLLEVLINDKVGLINIEFQTYNDSTMGERLARYNMITRFKYELPVLSCVIWLLKDGNVPQSPLTLDFLGVYDVITFNYLSVEIAQLTPESFLDSNQIGLLPLVSLTKGGTNREVIQRMFREIQSLEDIEEKDRQDVEFIAFTLASLVLKRTNVNDIEWLKRSFHRMHDIIKESPIYQEVLQEGEDRGLQRGIQQGLQRGLQQGRQEGELIASRKMLLVLVQARSAKMLEQARIQAEQIENQTILEDLITKIALAQTEEEAEHYLLSWRTIYKDLLSKDGK